LTRTGSLLLLLLIAACRTADPAYSTSDGRQVGDLEPLPYRIAMTPVVFSGLDTGKESPDGKDEYYFTKDEQTVQELMVKVMDLEDEPAEQHKLDALHTANDVLELDLEGPVFNPTPATMIRILEKAREIDADLVIIPRLVAPPEFSYKEAARTGASLALWVTTWVGGLFVQDRRYDVRMAIDFDIINPHDGTTIDTFTATSETIDTTVWDRDRWSVKGGTGLSILLPHQITGDVNKDNTSEALSILVCSRLAARLSGYLKEDFAAKERALIGTVRAIRPGNGADVEKWLDLEFEVAANQPITYTAVYLNDAPRPALVIDEHKPDDPHTPWSKLPTPDQQALGAGYHLLVKVKEMAGSSLTPKEGRNEVRIIYAVQGRYASRTLFFLHGRPEK